MAQLLVNNTIVRILYGDLNIVSCNASAGQIDRTAIDETAETLY
jgi:hypothetical protein